MTSAEAQAAQENANDSDDSDTDADTDSDDDSLTVEKTDGSDSDYTISASLSDERKEVLLAALSLEGQISYTWGGKATTTGWNARWSSGSGLDCSGFVQWAYWTGIGIRSGLGSTAQISYNYKEIKESELQPGDLGLIFKGGSGYEAENGTIYETEAEATEKNLKLAAKSVNRQLNGKEKITLNAVRKAKKAANAYETACENAGGKELTQAKKYEKKAAAAEEEAAELIAEAKEYEAQAADYLNSVTAQSVTALSLQSFAAVTDDSSTEESDSTSDSADESGQEDTSDQSSSSSDSSSSDSTSSDSSSSGSTSSDDTSSDETDSGSSSPDSGSDSSDTDDSGSSSDSSSSSDASAKAAELTAKAEALRAEAETLQEKAADWQKKAKALRKTAKSKKSAASVKLSKLKKKASIAKSEAVVAVADSYEISIEANHVGIYVGTDDNGNQLWVHCNSTKDTVSVDSVSYFTYFVRVIDEEHYTTADEGDLTVSDAKKRGKAERQIEKMIAEHALYKFVVEKFDEEEPPTAYAEQQTAAIQIYADEQNA